jgi:hypothetical protein
MRCLIFCLIIFSVSFSALAIDYPYLMRSPTALLMGDAFTAVNDDGFTLFYNPASLARNRADFNLYPINGTLTGTNILSDLDRFKDFPDDPAGLSDVLMDYPVHASAGTAPGFKLFNVGVSFLANESYDLLMRNQIHPMLDIDIRSDRGVLFGVGLPIGPGRVNSKSQSGSQTSFGIGAKYIERTGLSDSLALTGPTVLNSMGQDEVSKLLKSLGQIKGRAWGFDAGFEHVVRSGPSQFVLGLAILDITGTDFKTDSNPNKLKVANIKDQVNLGLAGSQNWKYFNFGASADVRALNEQIDFGKRVRLGAHVGMPGLKFMAGMNSGYYSYGATLDLLFMKLTGGFYDVEIGSKYKQTQSKRFILYLSLFDFSFDA